MGLFTAILQVSGVLIIIQGLALGLLVVSRWRHPGNPSLAVLLVLLGSHGLGLLSWGGTRPPLAPAPASILGAEVLLYGPLMWRYMWLALHRGERPRLPYAIHFLPAAFLVAVYGISYLVLGDAEFSEIAVEVFNGGGPLWVKALELGKLIQGVAYAVAIVVLWLRNKEGLRRWADRVSRIRWLRALAVAYLGNWALAFGGNALRWALPEGSSLTFGFVLVQSAAVLSFLYVAGFFALRFPAILEPKEAREVIRRALNLDEEFVNESLRRLEKARAEGVLADPEIDLPGLAARLGLHPNELSFIVNDSLGMGFREYVNASRLEIFLEKRKSGSPKSILDDAVDCGFASKTSFLRAFKARYGMTPTEYLKK